MHEPGQGPTASGVAYGCSKCRYNPAGCARCKRKDFKPRIPRKDGSRAAGPAGAPAPAEVALMLLASTHSTPPDQEQRKRVRMTESSWPASIQRHDAAAGQRPTHAGDLDPVQHPCTQDGTEGLDLLASTLAAYTPRLSHVRETTSPLLQPQPLPLLLPPQRATGCRGQELVQHEAWRVSMQAPQRQEPSHLHPASEGIRMARDPRNPLKLLIPTGAGHGWAPTSHPGCGTTYRSSSLQAGRGDPARAPSPKPGLQPGPDTAHDLLQEQAARRDLLPG